MRRPLPAVEAGVGTDRARRFKWGAASCSLPLGPEVLHDFPPLPGTRNRGGMHWTPSCARSDTAHTGGTTIEQQTGPGEAQEKFEATHHPGALEGIRVP